MIWGSLSIVFVAILSSCALGSPGRGVKFDYFTFTQSWPPATCADKQGEHKCLVKDEVTTWLVHGLWPSDFTHESPTECNSSWKFDYDKIKSLRPQLDKYWANLYVDTPITSFWQHEWKTHGTCSTGFSETSDELKYFQKGLVLNDQYNVTRMLQQANIVPKQGSTYPYKSFIKAVKDATNAEPNMQCTCAPKDDDATKKTKSMAFQLEICLSIPLLKPIDCPGYGHAALHNGSATPGGPGNSCRHCSIDVIYPPIRHG